VGAGDVVGVLLGDLLDVDAAHVAEDEHRALCQGVVDDPGVVLLYHGSAGLHQHGVGLLAVDLQLQNLGGHLPGLYGGVGELDPAGLHAASAEHLGLEDDGVADVISDALGVVGGGGGAVLG